MNITKTLRLFTLNFCLLPSAFCLLPSPARAQWADANNWPQFRGNGQLTGVSKAEVPQNLRVVWTFEAGDAIESSAAIADGAVYVGSKKGELVALDLGSGGVRWKYQTGATNSPFFEPT